MVDRGGKRRATAPLLKTLNERAVLETIRAAAPISRAEVSRRAGISKPTVSLALRSLVDAGLVREVAHDPGGPSYGAVFFEPVHEAALVLGLDVGAPLPARRDLRPGGRDPGAPGRRGARRGRRARARPRRSTCALRWWRPAASAGRGARRRRRRRARRRAARRAARIELAGGVGGLRHAGDRRGAARAARPAGDAWRTTSTSRPSASAGRASRPGVDDFAFLSIGTGVGAGLVLRGELHRGHHGAAGEIDLAFAGLGDAADPCAAPSPAGRGAASRGRRASSRRPTRCATCSPPRARATPSRGGVVAEVAHRIARNIAPLAAVADVSLVVLGGGIGANGDLLLAPIREHLRDDHALPAPRRGVEPGRGGGAGGRALDRPAGGARQRVREPHARRATVACVNLHHGLAKRAAAGRPVRVGLVGAGKFGRMFLAQVPRTPGSRSRRSRTSTRPRSVPASLAEVGWDATTIAARPARRGRAGAAGGRRRRRRRGGDGRRGGGRRRTRWRRSTPAGTW